MRSRCASCGARLDDDGTCPRCELEPVPLEDSDLGIRREDRYVALPPGPRWVPRRVPRESPIGPLVALAAAIGVLGLMVVLAPGDEPARDAFEAAPITDTVTDTVLLRTGPWGTEEIDVDAGTIRSAEPDVPVMSSDPAVDLEDPVLVETRLVTVAWSTCEGERCLAVSVADDVVVELSDPTAATLAPGGATLALLAPEESVMVDVATGTVTPITAGVALRHLTAWSPDGRWLFATTAGGGIDAIRSDGERFRVPVAPRATDRLAVRDPRA